MPAADAPIRRAPKPKKVKVAPSRGPQGLPGPSHAVAPVQRQRSAPVRDPFPSGLGTKPFAPQRGVARQRVRRARAKVPSDSRLPIVPQIAHPTPTQRKAAIQTVRAGLRKTGGARRTAAAGNNRELALLKYIGGLDSQRTGVLRSHGHVGQSIQLRPGPQHSHKLGFGPATITVNPHAAMNALLDIGHIRSGIPTLLATGSATGKLFSPLVRDAGTLAEAPFVGGYQFARGVADLGLHHNPKRLENLATGVLKGIEQSAPAALVTGHPGLALHRYQKHPLIEGLNFLGAEGAVGRGLGAAARGMGLAIGDTVRAPLALSDVKGSTLVHDRKPYSKDIFRAGAQRLADKRRTPAGFVVDRHGRKVEALKANDFQLPLRSEKERLLDRKVDYVASRANGVNRGVRERAQHELVRAMPRFKNRADREVLPFALEGTMRSAKTALADLAAHRARLAAVVEKAKAEIPTGKQATYRHKAEIAAAQERIDTIDKFLKSKPSAERVNAIFKGREAIGQRLNANDLKMAQAGLGSIHALRRSRLFPYAQEHMGAMHTADETGVAALRHPDGKFMSNTEIEAHMRAAGVDPSHVAYLPHRADVRGSRAFYSQFRGGNRPKAPNEPRTGSLYARGATGTNFETVVGHGVRQETQVAKADQIDKFVHEFGLKHETGRYFTSGEAKDLAQRLSADTGEQWVPMSALPAKLDKAMQEAIKQGQEPHKIESLSEHLINTRLDAATAGSKQTNVIVPAGALKRLADHVKPAGDIERALQYFNRPFRFSVLAQPRWLAGNFIEPYVIRLPTVGSGIFLPGLKADLRASAQVTKHLDPKIHDEIMAELRGGLFIGNRGASNFRTARDLPGVARYGQVIAHLPVVKQMAWFGKHAVTLFGHGFFAANRVLEQQVQKAAFGHIVRQEVAQFSGSWLKTLHLGDEAAKEAANGLVNTATQQRYAAQMDELLGKYSRWSPKSRHLIQSVFPFVPWSMAAARFVFWTLPAHNSTKTALLVQAGQANKKAWDEAHSTLSANARTGTLRDAMPTKDGGFVDLARYTPYGFSVPLAGGDTSGIASPLLPQLNGAINALHGQDAFGNQFPKGTNKTLAILNAAVEPVAGPTGMIRRLMEHGETSRPDSTIFAPKTKPGTSHGMTAFERTLSPVRPVYPSNGGTATHGSSETDKMLREASTGAAVSQSEIDKLLREAGVR